MKTRLSLTLGVESEREILSNCQTCLPVAASTQESAPAPSPFSGFWPVAM
jgi:hypothetical protein